MNNYLKNKAFETYMLLIEGHDKSRIDERLKKYIYLYMKRDRLSFDKAIVKAILNMGKLTQCDPSWLVPASTRTTDGGKGSGNFGHKGRPGQVGGSGKGGGELNKPSAKSKTEATVSTGTKSNEPKSFKTASASEVAKPSSFNVLNVKMDDFIKIKDGETRMVDGREQTLRYQNNFCKIYMDKGMGDKNADISMHRLNDMLQDAVTKIKSMYKESGDNPPLNICIGYIGRNQGSYNMDSNTLKINTFGQRQLKDTAQLRDTVLHEMIHMTDNGEYRNNKANNFNMVKGRAEWFAVAHCLALTGQSEFLTDKDPMLYIESDTPYIIAAGLSNHIIKNYGKEILMDVWNDKSEPSILNRIMKLKDKYKIKENNWRELLYNACKTNNKRELERRLLSCGFISNEDIIKRGGQNGGQFKRNR